ncbi:hypothetical protein K788_0007946 [Paraburkholderia caribensis MBA4]|uniref:Uncharacterized protein n=1 Tax=Paraburkholderia caribensis MBA4 TaxID=1323664 RepID=A0A0P0RA84_9BURK|nr:hypothetical protein K788_0007946 [Paraburkholderia caribensis MBA4]
MILVVIVVQRQQESCGSLHARRDVIADALREPGNAPAARVPSAYAD